MLPFAEESGELAKGQSSGMWFKQLTFVKVSHILELLTYPDMDSK